MAETVSIAALYSNVAKAYVIHRPNYPSSFFQFLSDLTPSHDLALDVATGNGQAASKLSEFFHHVRGTDGSDKQLSEAVQKPNIEYLCLPAELTKEQCEQNGFKENSFDLITCATAVHWLDAQKFFDISKILLKKPAGLVAIFGYEPFRISESPEINEIIESHFDLLKPLTPNYQEISSSNSFREIGYQRIYFPFEDISASWHEDSKQFSTEVFWGLEDMRGYFHSWSSTWLATEKWGYNPTESAIEKMRAVWGPEPKRKFTFPLFYRIGRNA